jgi:hypothetical protein
MFAESILEIDIPKCIFRVKKMLIGMIGRMGSGKTTAGKYLVDKHGFTRQAFANPLKRACQDLFLLSDAQVFGNEKEIPDPRWWGCTPRKLLQYVGTDLLREQMQTIIPDLGTTIFVHRFGLWYEKLRKENPDVNVVVDDVRFTDEINYISSHGGILIKIVRDSNMAHCSQHISEQLAQSECDCSYIIVNDGDIATLHHTVDKIICDLDDNSP